MKFLVTHRTKLIGFANNQNLPQDLNAKKSNLSSNLKLINIGWAEGSRMRDDERGWFPINHTDEIDSRHMRAKNLMQRYRLITASKNVINEILGK